MPDGVPAPRPTADDAPPSGLWTKVETAAALEADVQAGAGLVAGPAAGGRDYALPADRPAVRPRWRRRYLRAVVTADTGACTVAAVVAHAVQPVPPAVGAAFVGAFLAALFLARVYEERFLAQGAPEQRRLVVAAVALLALTATAALVADAAALRSLALVALPLALAGTLAVHVAGRAALLVARRRGRALQRSLVIGLERSVAELVRTTRRHPEGGLRVVGACIGRAGADVVEGVPVLGPPAAVRDALDAARADTVLLTAWSDVSQEDLRRLSWDLEGSGVDLLVAPRLAEVAVPRMHLRTVGGVPLLHVEEPEFSGVRRVAKSALDYGAVVPALVLLAPVLLAVALAVRLTSPGPVLFRQKRIGRHGRPFTMHKFRSMYVDAEDRLAEIAHLNTHGGGPLFKIPEDPRVTPVGRFLRRYSLDELPQLLDVLAGSMSLVGPRPPLPDEVAQYEDGVRRRLLVRPGITGLWQVSGRSDLTWEESVRLDLSYVENWSLPLDLSILTRTLHAVVARRGAY